MSWLSVAVRKLLDITEETSAYNEAPTAILPIQPPAPDVPEVSEVVAKEPEAVDLAHKIIAAMKKKNYTVDTSKGELEIVYLEGASKDGVLNDDEPDKFNDARLLIEHIDGVPAIVGAWQATTEPGKYWTTHPMNPGGAARIKFGQYWAWRVGMHNASKASGHEALVQGDYGKVTVYRDKNKDYLRTGDAEDTGYFGINQHHGYDNSEDSLGTSSAGCLVGRTKDGHRQFMKKVKSDPRYLADKKYTFKATIMSAEDLE